MASAPHGGSNSTAQHGSGAAAERAGSSRSSGLRPYSTSGLLCRSTWYSWIKYITSKKIFSQCNHSEVICHVVSAIPGGLSPLGMGSCECKEPLSGWCGQTLGMVSAYFLYLPVPVPLVSFQPNNKCKVECVNKIKKYESKLLLSICRCHNSFRVSFISPFYFLVYYSSSPSLRHPPPPSV